MGVNEVKKDFTGLKTLSTPACHHDSVTKSAAK
jgi:hypothetical protein